MARTGSSNCAPDTWCHWAPPPTYLKRSHSRPANRTLPHIRGDFVLQVFNCQLSLGIALLGMCFIWEHKYFGMLGDGNDGENQAVQYFSMLGRPMATSSNKSTSSAGHPPSLRAGPKLSKRHCIMRANWFIMLHLQSVQQLRHEMLGLHSHRLQGSKAHSQGLSMRIWNTQTGFSLAPQISEIIWRFREVLKCPFKYV